MHEWIGETPIDIALLTVQQGIRETGLILLSFLYDILGYVGSKRHEGRCCWQDKEHEVMVVFALRWGTVGKLWDSNEKFDILRSYRLGCGYYGALIYGLTLPYFSCD